MSNIMKDTLQYVTQTLFLAAVFALLAGGAIYTFMVFPSNNKRHGEEKSATPKI